MGACFLALAGVGCGRGQNPAQADPFTITVLYPVGDERSALRRIAPASLIFLPLMSRNEEGELNERGHFDRYDEASPFGYTNPTLIDLLKKAQATINPHELDRIYREFWPIFQAELPITGLYPLFYTTVAHRRVRGLSTSYRAQPLRYMQDLRLEDEG